MTNIQIPYCPNVIFDSKNISIGEFKTIEDCMSFPIHNIWCINRAEGNKFNKYKELGYRVLIICSWSRGDRWRFVVAITKDGTIKYFDLNDLPMDLVSNEYELTLGQDALEVLRRVSSSQQIADGNNNRKKIINGAKKRMFRGIYN